eukprot:2385148-Rhodomonas_salina.2
MRLLPVVLADRSSPAVLAMRPSFLVLADRFSPAVLAPRPLPAVYADQCYPARLELRILAEVLADLRQIAQDADLRQIAHDSGKTKQHSTLVFQLGKISEGKGENLTATNDAEIAKRGILVCGGTVASSEEPPNSSLT